MYVGVCVGGVGTRERKKGRGGGKKRQECVLHEAGRGIIESKEEGE